MAATDVESSVESAIASVSEELDDIFSLKQEQTTSLKAFVDEKYVSVILEWQVNCRLYSKASTNDYLHY